MNFLYELEQIIRHRIDENSTGSYTSQLVVSGTRRVAQKVGEEAVELALAAVAGSRSDQLEEAADLMFHFQVLLASLDLSLAEVADCLQARHKE
ncbi:MAG: phosphoribosyl-ATP diphosphatase [Gammaproteobacteria bacterium]|nr:phosphoribosyl-ATP diphosphatase [Gammaproteobacteria bacterium]MDH4314847.1 phosphoribosyl-ATP diphosphatase [Gammaproteobacteria bacterium]MDH5214650.1 phosphoribosyl-ATP diphosphatase [Gammaproteobacteria bacterium]